MRRTHTRKWLTEPVAAPGVAPSPPPPSSKDSILRLSKMFGVIPNRLHPSDNGVDIDGSDHDGHRPESGFERASQFVSSCLFGSLLVVGRDVALSNTSWFSMMVAFFVQVRDVVRWWRHTRTHFVAPCQPFPPPLLQVLSFPLAPIPEFPWAASSISFVSRALSYLSLTSNDVTLSPNLRLVTFASAVAFQLLVLATAAWIGTCYCNEEFPIIWPIKVRAPQRGRGPARP